jgi:hypothetical protein
MSARQAAAASALVVLQACAAKAPLVGTWKGAKPSGLSAAVKENPSAVVAFATLTELGRCNAGAGARPVFISSMGSSIVDPPHHVLDYLQRRGCAVLPMSQCPQPHDVRCEMEDTLSLTPGTLTPTGAAAIWNAGIMFTAKLEAGQWIIHMHLPD